MFIVQVSPEMTPVAKVGGLADVVFGLSRELEVRGNDVEILLPKYDCMRYDHIFDLPPDFHDLWIPWGDGTVHCTVLFGFVHGRKCFFIEPHSDDRFFERGCFYGQNDDPVRYAFFAKAALEFLLALDAGHDRVAYLPLEVDSLRDGLLSLFECLALQFESRLDRVGVFCHCLSLYIHVLPLRI